MGYSFKKGKEKVRSRPTEYSLGVEQAQVILSSPSIRLLAHLFIVRDDELGSFGVGRGHGAGGPRGLSPSLLELLATSWFSVPELCVRNAVWCWSSTVNAPHGVDGPRSFFVHVDSDGVELEGFGEVQPWRALVPPLKGVLRLGLPD